MLDKVSPRYQAVDVVVLPTNTRCSRRFDSIKPGLSLSRGENGQLIKSLELNVLSVLPRASGGTLGAAAIHDIVEFYRLSGLRDKHLLFLVNPHRHQLNKAYIPV